MTIANLIRIERTNYLLSAILVAVAAITTPQEWALGILVGAALSCANFTVMRKLVQAWSASNPRGRRAAQIVMIPKMGILMLLIYLAARFLPISVLGLATGFAVFLVSIGVETVRQTVSPMELEAEEAKE